ncbi:MAG: DUF4270 domain-containing protein [Bacteroidota bacterium]
MKFIKLDLLTLLISLFLFASCENTSTIGLEIDPNSTIEGALVDTLTISSRTIMDDATNTGALVRYPLGFLKDPTFGTTEAKIALSVGLPSWPYSFGTTPVLDSAVLVLSYAGEFYGDSTQVYTVNVNQLTNNLHTEESFLSSRTYPTNSRVIGTKTGRLFPTSKYKITDIVTGNKDTLKSVNPQLRIKLDNNFIQEYIVNQPEGVLKSDALFKNFFKGLHVQVNNPSGNGAMMFFDLAGTNSNLSLYYRKTNATATPATIDTLNAIFLLGSTSNRVAASVKHDYTGTAIETQLNNPNQQYAVTYLQPLVGLRSKISFPSLEKFSASTGQIVVNKAELVVDLATGSDIKPFEPALRLALYRYDIAEQRVLTEVNGNNAPETIGGYFDPTKKQYVFNITAYIQNIISKKTKDYGTFIAPIPTNAATEWMPIPSVSSAARSVIGAHKKNPATGESTMRLNLYYTKAN